MPATTPRPETLSLRGSSAWKLAVGAAALERLCEAEGLTATPQLMHSVGFIAASVGRTVPLRSMFVLSLSQEEVESSAPPQEDESGSLNRAMAPIISFTVFLFVFRLNQALLPFVFSLRFVQGFGGSL